MISSLGTPQLYPLGEPFAGDILIATVIKNAGMPCDALVALFIYEGSILAGHGTLLASYGKEVHFEEGEEKEVTFEHQVVQTGESRRDIGIEVIVNGVIEVSAEFDDVYQVAGTTETMTGSMSALMGMGMMAMMVSTMMPEGGEGFEL